MSALEKVDELLALLGTYGEIDRDKLLEVAHELRAELECR